ncbi:ATPase inhibitor IATP mitochondria [Penicillium cf. griseofulvum]|uniref:ATPase inhibitor, mitochondrial n=1 Tax=Penicillium cf. griseofulvum TaxID=2972120 RepID=A0A9W9MS95_9EURO|nr:ATPase inhibitor IATP mitochondria [Penicillium cf. griseofulvum]KAJ5440403.1 ATPase inhibitor IATP mitochondria [Penicillium cf. griseofulvum]KAJ5448450.1 ATPase inhibitor IATP mitochondria [Penicillium cf. griseofulvum]
MQSTTLRPILRITTNSAHLRSLSTTPRIMAAGDIASAKSGAEKDTFARREAAHEAMYIREKEMEKLARLKAKIQEQRKHMDELDKHIDEYTKGQGGEQN